MKFIVFREITWGFANSRQSAMSYMSTDGKDVNYDYAAEFTSADEALAAAKRLGWKRRFR